MGRVVEEMDSRQSALLLSAAHPDNNEQHPLLHSMAMAVE